VDAFERPHITIPPPGFAENTAVAFEVQLQQMMAPMLALATFIHDQPSYPNLARRFDTIATELLSAVRRVLLFVRADRARAWCDRRDRI